MAEIGWAKFPERLELVGPRIDGFFEVGFDDSGMAEERVSKEVSREGRSNVARKSSGGSERTREQRCEVLPWFGSSRGKKRKGG